MPRTKALPTAAPPNNDAYDLKALTAAGKRLPANPDYTKVSRTARGWQDSAWNFYDTIGEYRYACDWVGNMLSKATLFVAKDGVRVVTDGPGVDYVYSLFGGPEAQGQMLRETGIHLTVAGEEYIVGVTVKDVEEWRVVAATELTTRGGKYYASSKEIVSDGKPFVMRLWRPHPRRFQEATAPSRAILSILAELDALTKRIFAEIDSRLAGAGVLLLPSEMTLPVSQQTNAAGELQSTATVADVFKADLQEAMLTAIADREDASAMVPIVATVPGEHVNNIKHLTFWSSLDEKSIELRTEAIRRLALGLDMPPEVLTGVADTNHWNAWQVEEAAIKAHAEPLLALICESLTEGYLRPLLIDDGMDPLEADSYTIVADTSMLRLRPNRSKEAFELYDRMQLDGAALRRETGFDEDDAPDGPELRELFLRKVAAGSTTPDLVAAALRALGVPLGAITTAPAVQERPVPSLEAHPTQEPPEQLVASTPPSDDGLLGASEVIVFRALERAGNRIRSRIGRKIPGVAAADMYLHVPVTTGQLDDLLVDAFEGIERYVGCRQVPPDRLTTCLDTYCRALMIESRPHDPQVLATYLALTKVSA
jgi:hypothetical protein